METLNNLNPVVTAVGNTGAGANIAVARYLRDAEYRDIGISKMKDWVKVCNLPEKPFIDFQYGGFTCPKCGGHHFGISAIPPYVRHPNAGKRTGRCHTYGPLACCDYTWDDDDRPVGIFHEYTREQHCWEGSIDNVRRHRQWTNFILSMQRNEDYQQILRRCAGFNAETLRFELEDAGAKDWDWESVNEEMVETAEALAHDSWLKWPSFITALARQSFYIELFRVPEKISGTESTQWATMVKIKSQPDGLNFITVRANPSVYWYFAQLLSC